MNGPMKMYRTRQIVRHDINISLPKCMYKVKNIHATANNQTGPLDHVSPPRNTAAISEQVQNLQNQSEMNTLMKRQEKILLQLDELREQILILKSNLTTSDGQTNVKTSEPSSLKIGELPDIVINVSPSYPPYSLLLIRQLWSKTFKFVTTTHLHSTITSLPDKAIAFSRLLENNTEQSHLPVINLRVIWKDVGPMMELIVSQIPIVGEVNMLRYLARVNPNLLPYENVENIFDIDSVLDTCYCLVRARTKTERATLIQNLNKNLGKSQFLCGHSSITIADVAASSAIKQVAENDINQNLTKWFQRCNAIIS